MAKNKAISGFLRNDVLVLKRRDAICDSLSGTEALQ